MIEATNPAATADKFALLHTPDRPAIRQELTLQELKEVLGIPGDNECEFATLNTSTYSQYVEPNGKIPITCELNESGQILVVQLNNNAHVEVASLCNDLVGTDEPTFSECRETFKGLGEPGSTTVIKIDYPPGLDQNGVIRIGDAPFIEVAPDPADFASLSNLVEALSNYTYPKAQNTQVPSPELESWASPFTPEQEKKYENLIDKLTYVFLSIVGALGLLGLVVYIKDKLTYVEEGSDKEPPRAKPIRPSSRLGGFASPDPTHKNDLLREEVGKWASALTYQMSGDVAARLALAERLGMDVDDVKPENLAAMLMRDEYAQEAFRRVESSVNDSVHLIDLDLNAKEAYDQFKSILNTVTFPLTSNTSFSPAEEDALNAYLYKGQVSKKQAGILKSLFTPKNLTEGEEDLFNNSARVVKTKQTKEELRESIEFIRKKRKGNLIQ